MGRLILIILVLFSVTAIYSEASAVEERYAQVEGNALAWQDNIVCRPGAAWGLGTPPTGNN
ncbi:hypothetical protein [Thiohalophilus sp.]|uniref:hypothetical protein n=1 Tax=Thiohalophilus sp. TaxID=3028392 RepID=UPI002ACDB4DC|nr:hypothetical protein [Thiohalophilus sp.]MDZ7663582.1 hypothetical protein [Thiohalophilus sp.]